MTLREFLQNRRKAEYPVFVRVLQALPTNRVDYQPHKKSQSAAEIVWTLARETRACCELVDNGLVNWLTEPLPFREQYAALDDRIQRMDEAGWQKKGAASHRGQELPGSAGRRVPLVHILRRNPPPWPIEHLHPGPWEAKSRRSTDLPETIQAFKVC